MADNSTVSVSGNLDIDYDICIGACDQWKLGNEKLKSCVKTPIYTSSYDVLTSPEDIISSYLNEFRSSVDEIVLFSEAQESAFRIFVEPPEDDEDETEESPISSDPPTGGGGNNNDDSSEDTISPVVTPPVEIPVSELIPLTTLEDVSVSQIDGIVDSLIDLAGDTPVDEFVSEQASADKIKEALLASPYIPDDLKKLLQEADSELVRQTIQALMNGEMPEVFALNPLNIGIVYSYLSKIASDNGITIEQLLNDPQYSELLKTHLAGFEDVVDLIKSWKDLSAEEFQANLLSIYDGDGIGDMKDSTVNIMRTFVDYIASATEIPAEELLLDVKYADILKNATEQFAKTSVFMGATSHYSADGMQNVVSSLVDGTNAAALGMDEREVANFKSEIDALAKEKGVTSESLLSDSKYADDVKNALASSENAKEVGLIYAKSESLVSQNVAKNLYNTVFETKSENSTNVDIGSDTTVSVNTDKIIASETVTSGS